jgi:hypothetical protein
MSAQAGKEGATARGGIPSMAISKEHVRIFQLSKGLVPLLVSLRPIWLAKLDHRAPRAVD